MKFFAWLRRWIRTAVAASSRKDFYRQLDDRVLGESVAHLALLSVFLWVLPFLIVFFIDTRHGLQAFTEGLRTRIPAGAVFEMKKGAFSNTLPAPLVFGDKEFKLIVNSATGPLALQEGESGFVVNATGIVQRDPLRTQALSFARVPDFRVTREELRDRIARWAPPALFLGALLTALVVFSLTLAGFLISAALHALLLWFAMRIAKRPWPWKRALIATMYAATLPIVVNALVSAAGLNLGMLPNLLYWLILIWIAYDAITRGQVASGKGERDERQKEDAVVDRPDADRRDPA